MADFAVECYTAEWWGQAVLHILVLIVFTVGVIAAIPYMLFKRRHKLDEPETKKYFGMLYTIYKDDRYYYEAINMSFKVLLWMAAVMMNMRMTMLMRMMMTMMMMAMMVNEMVILMMVAVVPVMMMLMLTMDCGGNKCRLRCGWRRLWW